MDKSKRRIINCSPISLLCHPPEYGGCSNKESHNCNAREVWNHRQSLKYNSRWYHCRKGPTPRIHKL